MDTQLIISLFGSAVTSQLLEEFLQALGVAKRPKLPKGEYNAYLELKKLGVALLFQDEAFYKHENTPLGKAPLILIGAFFYANGHDGYSEYRGELPGTLSFRDTRKEAILKLGKSEWQMDEDGVVLTERWSVAGLKVSVDYDSDNGQILLIYYGSI